MLYNVARDHVCGSVCIESCLGKQEHLQYPSGSVPESSGELDSAPPVPKVRLYGSTPNASSTAAARRCSVTRDFSSRASASSLERARPRITRVSASESSSFASESCAGGLDSGGLGTISALMLGDFAANGPPSCPPAKAGL